MTEIPEQTASKASPRPEVVSLQGVSKRFTVRKDTSIKERIVTLGRAGRRHRQDFWALSDLSLDIYAGTTVGLIGHNGSGKSTLLKVIGGIIQPTDGSVSQRGRIAALLELGAGFHPDLTGRENVFLNAAVLGLSQEETLARFDDILDFSGIGSFIDTQVKFYSSGMYVRLAFAVAVHTDPDVLLVDEVLAVGDEQFQKKCMDKIEQFQLEGRTIIIVSHALDQVKALCDRVIVMDQGRLAYDGLPGTAVERFRDLLARNGVGQERPDQMHRAAEITAVEVLTGDGAEGTAIISGEDITLRVHVRSIRPLDAWAIGFSVDSDSGQMALASNTDLLGVTLDPLTASRVVEVRLSQAHLAPGTYAVNANISGISEATSHSLMRAATFTVAGRTQVIGPVSALVDIA